MSEMLRFELPWPPTANNLFVNRADGKGRRLSALARSYVKAVGDLALIGKIPRFRLSGRLGCMVWVYPPDERARDLDNLLKASLDALKKAGVFADDSHFDLIHMQREATIPGGRLYMQLYEYTVQPQPFPAPGPTVQ